MVEKGALLNSTSQSPRLSSWPYRGLSSLTASLFLVMLFVWLLGSFTVRSYQRQIYFGIHLHGIISSLSSQNMSYEPHASTVNTSTVTSSPASNRTHQADSSPTRSSKHFKPPLPLPSFLPSQNVSHIPESPHLKLTHSSSPQNWISISLEPNFTSHLISRWLSPGGQLCHDMLSTSIKIPELDSHSSIQLFSGDIHEFVFFAYGDSGIPRCSGGDYFETDLSGDSWKSRPPVKDHGNGSYSFSLQIHQEFAGDFNLSITLLFRSFEGLKLSTERFAYGKELRNIRIKFLKGPSLLPELQICTSSDFSSDVWSGRWTRLGKNDQCSIDNDGRFRCLGADFPCRSPWCNGSLGSLESNGWVYSAHCAFQIFSQNSAWQCLRNRWIFFWGDSNHVDTIRNLLNFVLGLPEVHSVSRRFDANFTNPSNSSESVRITSIFNGHWNETKNYEGLNSLHNDGFRELTTRYFSKSMAPDTIILNSGLHDGIHWRSLRGFVEAADYAAQFWEETLAPLRTMGKMPRLFYRTTIATGGYARNLAFNPSKMEAFNLILLEKLKEKKLLSGVIDDFDLTFPWHFDNRCSDGVHYGRAPAKARWRDGQIGHQYFVDLMLGHVLLNAIYAAK